MRGEDGGPPARAQRNFTDPDSRILPPRDGFVHGYNGQIAVNATHQVIVAHRLDVVERVEFGFLEETAARYGGDDHREISTASTD